jgi:hypothetical protein
MTRRSKLWRWAAGIFVFINAAGAIGAAMMGERRHYDMHLALLLVGVVVYLVWQAGPRGQRHDVANSNTADPRLDYLQQSVDALALEIERLGEAQRFREKALIEKGDTPPQRKVHDE